MANFLEKLNKSSQQTVQKVKETTEISKLNVQIQQCEMEREKEFTRLGKIFYGISSNAEAVNLTQEPVSSLMASISQCNTNIEKLRLEINRIKNIKKCTTCGRECSSDSMFCANCGSKLIQENNIGMSNHCSNCGTELSEDDVFCFNCGNKVQ